MKTILITGATDGIGLETAKMLAKEGHNLFLHGRSQGKLDNVKGALEAQFPKSSITVLQADLSLFDDVKKLAVELKANTDRLDILINNAGVFSIENPITAAGLDARFMVNTIAPYMLTLSLVDVMDEHSRVINVSSAAQAPVNFAALRGETQLSDGAAYAQSKLGITMWTAYLGEKYQLNGPKMVSVNPKSLLGSKMVKDAYGIAGGDLKEGAKIFIEAALSERFANVAGDYFDNDHNTFASPHPFASYATNRQALISELEAIISAN
ncbi:SDR family NAD(P)-dependent oxidoreductase [Alteromonas sp. PRIM-21]|uniref:SDR family NAD(P)-dependent oxidoreductase n=1 Tax=Alteromonas sp. PRIM-21 TaxID=1454978 RepID=UPI0022B98431|nr:SDR family NAD(P)-dependent oxidoreductase [Alteromonas sp. PRIM-21]MCZ8528182.1 SDR family NAD(P)-dependent oxidoreductase [Alteromonas sp. PRIM-21]